MRARRFVVASSLAAHVLVALMTRDARAQTPPPGPPAPPGPPPAANGPVPVRVETDPALTMFDRTNEVTSVAVNAGRFGTRLDTANVFAALCTGSPCNALVAPGPHELALRKVGGALVEGDPVTITGPSNLRGELIDRSGLRRTGIIGLIASDVAGVAVLVASPNEAWGGVGITICVLGTIGFGALTLIGDGAKFAVTPLAIAGASRREAGGPSLLPNGAALTLRF